ncbi:Transcription initiation factor IIF subunit beta [Termitomyces sp. J132]|nr:Transcription initiation factor IIF subunit beta [Termitomyces sp. J132]
MDADDDRKPFDAEVRDDDDAQPDPDEELMLEQGNGRVWLVKVPKFLLARWAAIDAEGVHLASIRIYNHDPASAGKPRIVLFLPPSPTADPSELADRPAFSAPIAPASDGPEPDCYELEMVHDSVDNQLVVAERPKDPSLSVSTSAAAATTNSRARTTILTGRVRHECNLRPRFTERYRQQMRARHLQSNTRVRQIRMIDDAGVAGGRGGINRLSSGVGVGAGKAFGDLIKTKPKYAKGTFERMARMPRNQLLDQIFTLFRDPPRWGIKPLREKTQQPEVYLKEVLSEVAFLGEYNGLWELKDNYKEPGIKAENVPQAGPSGDMKIEVDEDEDEDEDEDMEEIS